MTTTMEQVPRNPDSAYANPEPDRRILSRREVEAFSIILDIVAAARPIEPRREMECTEEHVFGDFYIDVHLRKVLRGGMPVHLTPREYDLLLALARRDGAPARTAELAEEVWKRSLEPGSRTLSQHVFALRRKLERDPSMPRYITTVSKVGYRLEGGSRSISTRGSSDIQR